jgi:hypothetical protein
MTVFITGPGRSGTSFLVQLFTRLGFDTGYEPYQERYDQPIRAGCESVGPDTDIVEEGPEAIRKAFKEAPRILKGPVWAYLLKYFYLNQLVEIERVIMPIRDLTDASYSRLDAGLDFLLDKDFTKMPGAPKAERQENILAMLIGKVVEVCYVHEIPLTLMRFPLLVEDEEYCYRKVVELEPVNRERFGEVYKELANPSQVKWSRPDGPGSGGAGVIREQERRPA